MTGQGLRARRLEGAHPPDTCIVVLNGGSSSGTSSIARRLQELLPGMWLTFGVDSFIDALAGRGEHSSAGISFRADGTISFTEGHRAAERAWYVGLSAMASAGAHLILDEVLLSGGAGQARLQAIFGEEGVVWVGVRCAPDVAEAREAGRPDRVQGMARHQALRVHDGVRYDLVVDTTTRSAEEGAADIARLLPSA